MLGKQKTSLRICWIIAIALAAIWGGQSLSADSVAYAEKKASHGDDKLMQGLDCNACHNTKGWALSNAAGAQGGFDHAKTGFPLTGEHNKVICTDCHKPKQGVSRDCFSCHADQHRGKLGLQCDSCHNTQSWLQTRAIRRHRLTRLPLTGMHAVLDCTSCHIRQSARQYQAVPADCFACHKTDYLGSDVHPSHVGNPATGTPAFSRDCSQCHQASGWSPAFVNPLAVQSQAIQSPPKNHDTVFVLSRGPHRGAPCTTCHVGKTRSRAVTCAGCHIHNPVALRRQHGKFVSRSATSCLGCHPQGGMR